MSHTRHHKEATASLNSCADGGFYFFSFCTKLFFSCFLLLSVLPYPDFGLHCSLSTFNPALSFRLVFYLFSKT